MATTLTPDTEAKLTAGLKSVCADAGVSPAGAELIKYTINAVYHLTAAPAVVRLSRGEHASIRAQKVVKVAEMFANLDMPTVRLFPGIHQPILVDDWVATFWTHLPQPAGYLHRPVEVVDPLIRIHAIDRLNMPLPQWDTVGEARRRVRRVELLARPLLEYTRAWARTTVGTELDTLLAQLLGWADQLDQRLYRHTWRLPQGVIHGDARIGNLLYHPDGHIVLCDLDSVCIGPREWDLAPLALGPVRFGQDPTEYRAFADTYGHDITHWRNDWRLLRQIRELQLVTSVIGNLYGRPDVARQLAIRIRSVLDQDDTAEWRSHQ